MNAKLLAIVWVAAACLAQDAGEVVRVAPELDQIVPNGARIEKLAGGLGFTEGPVWMRGGFLLFSDIPHNVIRRWTPEGLTVVREKSGSDDEQGNGSNGLTLDGQGRLAICEHGRRRVVRLEKDGRVTVLADRFEGKRLNSPNDAVYGPGGALYFTDPPYGLPKQDADPSKEIPFSGVYRLANGKLRVLYRDLARPNGLAFSPGGRHLYVANSEAARKIWMRFEVRPDGSLGEGKVFHDVTAERAPGVPDGMKVDTAGNVYGTGPGGIWILSPEGKHLGTIRTRELPANCAWGDDGRTLYITARTGLYRIRLNVPGIRP